MRTLRPFLKPAEEALAFEETLFRRCPDDEDIVHVWRARPAFIIGRNQNPFLEIHPDVIRDASIPVLRRISGGGTIYMDEGTLNFTFITPHFKERINDYRHFLNPVVDVLESMGIEATFRPKSHLFHGSKKISGNAQAFAHGRLMHHGTLLYDADLNRIEHGLHRTGSLQVSGHQVLSDKRAVTNIKTIIPDADDPAAFTRDFHKQLTAVMGGNASEPWMPSASFLAEAERLAQDKYQNWAWNFGKTPAFTTHVAVSGGDLTLKVKDGCIAEVTPDDGMTEPLKGVRFMSETYDDLIAQLR
jgi:lipoate-protein ligase A